MWRRRSEDVRQVTRLSQKAGRCPGPRRRQCPRTRLVWLILIGLLLPLRVYAAVPGLGDLASTEYSEIREGVEALAASDSRRALPVLDALRDGTLYAGDGRLVIAGGAGALTDAETGRPAPGLTTDSLRLVHVNNLVRRALAAAIGGLELSAPDQATRAAAAAALFTAHDPAVVPALDRAIAREHQPSVRRLLRQARAACLLASSAAPVPDRLAAIRVLRARGDLDARSLLASASYQPGPVGAAARRAIAGIDRDLRLWSLAQDAYYGLSLGSVLLLAAIGLAITFGVMGVINMAHGELVMLGAYTAYVVQNAIAANLPALAPASLVIAVPLAFLVGGAVGIAIERLLIRFLYGRPLETLLATWGLSLVLQQAVRSLFGPDNRAVATPAWMSGAVELGGIQVTFNRLAIIVFAGLVFAALMLALRRTSLGLRMRAVTQNRRMAAAMGIRTPWIDALTFGLGSGVAGMAGVALSQIDNVSPNLGQGYIIDSFMVVVFGGVGNLWGTLIAAFALGEANEFLEPLAGAVLAKIVVLVLLIAFIQRRPRGLFPIRGRAVEA